MNMTDRNVDLIEKYNSGEDDDLLVLSNKPPTWSSESQSYVINFHGRVTRVTNICEQCVNPRGLNTGHICPRSGSEWTITEMSN